MADRTDLPKIKPDAEPSIINHKAGVYGLLGSMGSSLALASLNNRATVKIVEQDIPEFEKLLNITSSTKKFAILGVVGGLIGALIGGNSEKKKQEVDQQQGRVVKDPGYFNKGLVSGTYFSTLINAPIIISKLRAEDILFRKIRITKLNAAIAVVGMVTGSILRKNSLQHDFDQSIAIRDGKQAETQDLLHQAANQLGTGASFKNSVTPDEAAVLADKQDQKSSHAAAHEAAHVQRNETARV